MNGLIHTKIYVRDQKHRPTLNNIVKQVQNPLPSEVMVIRLQLK